MSEQLIALAESIDAARILANANESTARQSGVYGDLTDALAKTLSLILGPNGLNAAYQAMADGYTVREAIDRVTAQRGPAVQLTVQQTPINTRNEKQG